MVFNKKDEKNVNNYDKIVPFDDFLSSPEFKSSGVYLISFYDIKRNKLAGVPFLSDLLEFRRHAMRSVNYADYDSIKSELHLFPKEYGVVILGYFDSDFRNYTKQAIFLGELYNMLSDKQKMLFENSQAVLDENLAKSIKVNIEKANNRNK